MSIYSNPFEYEQATTLTPEFVKRVFIEDHNFTRFIQSTRNIFLIGERGSGKSMTLLYNSSAVQGVKCEDPDHAYLGVYVPCNTTLTHKREYELLPEQGLAGVISEHFMVLGIAYAISGALSSLVAKTAKDNDTKLREELNYVFDDELPSHPDQAITEALMLYLQRESRKSQVALNSLRKDEFREKAFTFATLILPLLRAFRRVPELQRTHFLLLIDDAHDLNPFQKAALNSWIAYRDRSLFSLKIAVADVFGYDFKTASGGVILEGHDFLTIDLQKPFQSPGSDFGKMAREVIAKRLATTGVQTNADKFFPESTEFSQDLDKCREEVQREAAKKYPDPGSEKQRTDYVYKYVRVKYFRDRAAKANLPPYSGFDTITHVSTGVIRNLLMPCYWMYDAVVSARGENENPSSITVIPSEIQSKVLKDRSEQLWKWIDSSLSSSIDNCSLQEAKQIYQLLDNLGHLFKTRLMTAKSEPRALAFTISMISKEHEGQIMPLLHIARRAQLIYFRTGPAKDEGRRETYYVPNRMLWPIRGIDVVGQHARVSLKAKDVWAAANGQAFSVAEVSTSSQAGLFDAED